LALNDKEQEFTHAVNMLKITNSFAEKIGCLPSRAVDDYAFATATNEFLDWSKLYNDLWRTVGRFFRRHPKFGVN
jgi:hypothetical protein